MLSKSKIKIITSLKLKKQRVKHGLFVVEGKKSVFEFLHSKNIEFELDSLFYTEGILDNTIKNAFEISEIELKKISFLKNPNKILAVFKIPLQLNELVLKGLVLALDNVKDPGNLGTIIRLCDWFGVAQLICSKETVDCYNEKVIQASMGSLTRVSIIYTDLANYLATTKLSVFATQMDGENIYQKKLPKNGVIVMGNEANGISNELLKQIDTKISIPKFGLLQQTESLNVATATAIILSEFRRS